jgi:hypothetical protein
MHISQRGLLDESLILGKKIFPFIDSGLLQAMQKEG